MPIISSFKFGETKTVMTPEDKARIECQAHGFIDKLLEDGADLNNLHESDVIAAYIAGATAELERNGWISVKDRLPERKPNWNHSEQVVVFYEANELDASAYGIAYYHYDPPFNISGFIDFQRYGRIPSMWRPLSNPKS